MFHNEIIRNPGLEGFVLELQCASTGTRHPISDMKFVERSGGACQVYHKDMVPEGDTALTL